MVHFEVYLNKYVVSIGGLHLPAPNALKIFRKLPFLHVFAF